MPTPTPTPTLPETYGGSALKRGQMDAVIIIPTVANPKVLVPTVQTILQEMDEDMRTMLVVSINPLDPDHGDESRTAIIDLWKAYEHRCPDNGLLIVHTPGPRGFGGAINDGLEAQLGEWQSVPLADGLSRLEMVRPEIRIECFGSWIPGLPTWGITVVYNDDLHATPGWLSAMYEALHTDVIVDSSEVPDPKLGHRPHRSAADYGEIGLVGPMSDYTAGVQQINAAAMSKLRELGHDRLAFSAWWKGQAAREPAWTATFLSGFCMGFSSWAIERLSKRDEQGRFLWLFDERYRPAGYEDNDLCARAASLGIRAAVATQAWLHHLGSQTFDHEFPEAQRGLAMRLTHYDHWRPVTAHGHQRVVAAYRTLLTVPNDLSQWKTSLLNIARVADGIAVLLTGNPAAIAQHPEWERDHRGMQPVDLEMIRACATDPSNAPDAVARWIRHWTQEMARQHGMPTRVSDVQVEVWQGEFNEREERNHVLGLAEHMQADWIFAVDSDEAVEIRWTREHLDRLVGHPDPAVNSYAVRFLNHWDSTRLVNVTKPWGDGGDYTGGMAGFRLYRVCKADPRTILAGGENGLHCGNIPQVDPTGKRASSWRMRHFGYLREQDRQRKMRRYEQQDPTPNPLLIGGNNYGHILHEEHMVMQPYLPENGIGLSVLLYEAEDPNSLGRLLDQLHGVVDRVVLVWTGSWDEQDKDWAPQQPARWCRTQNTQPTRYPLAHQDPMQVSPWAISDEDWPTTGPTREMARMAEHFQCEWVHHPLDDHLGEARNAGLAALRGSQGMTWALFMDPDELVNMRQAAMISRMAECTDAMGWLFRFSNPHQNGEEGSVSDSIRMCRLNPPHQPQMMSWHGRVHESMERAARVLKEAGFGHVIRVAPFTLPNLGLTGSDAEMQAKLDRYFRLACLQLEDDPNDHVGWQTVALYYANEGCMAAALEAMNRAFLCSGHAYLPGMLLGHMYARMASTLLVTASERARGSSIGRGLHEQAQLLHQMAPPKNRHGAARDPELRPLMTEEEALAHLGTLPMPIASTEE